MVMMMKKKKKFVICMLLVLLLAVNYATEAESACTRRCGDVDIHFPFGIEAGCFATGSYASSGINLTGSPFLLSDARNIFTAIGCDVDIPFPFGTSTSVIGNFSDFNTTGGGGCVSLCSNKATFVDDTYSSNDGCCRTAIPPRPLQRHGGRVDWSCSDHACPNQQRRNYKDTPKVVSFVIISAAAGGSFLIFVIVNTLRRSLKKRNLLKKSKENYPGNVELLKNAESSSDDIVVEGMKIYEPNEMENTTYNYFNKTKLESLGAKLWMLEKDGEYT